MGEILSANTLNCIYFGLFILAWAHAIILVVTGGLSNVDMPDVDVDIPQINLPGDVDIPAPVCTLAAGCASRGMDCARRRHVGAQPDHDCQLITAFGGIGVLALQFLRGRPPLESGMGRPAARCCCRPHVPILQPIPDPIAVFQRSQGKRARGLTAEVSVPIGTGATGQVAYNTKADGCCRWQRRWMAARSRGVSWSRSCGSSGLSPWSRRSRRKSRPGRSLENRQLAIGR